jgi:acyl-CoA synthetase (AMP-forming)/AMP-acid ligase II
MHRTEASQLFSSLSRPRDDKAWNYLRPLPQVLPYLLMRPVGGGICECIVLDGLKTKAVTNSNDPPNSFHTSDLFVAHPTIPDAWKFVGRSDDRVTLLNGEKVLPLPIEGAIVQDLLVKEAVVFGVDRPVPGLLLFRSKAASDLTEQQFLDCVWPTIEKANQHSEAFSQIGKEMVVAIPNNVDYPSTDKGSIKRAQVYHEFQSVISDVYNRLESGGTGGTLKLNSSELEDWILSEFQKLGILLPNANSDFFSAGVDSLKAIQMRGLIIKYLDLRMHTEKLPSMIIYDSGTARRLATFLHSPQDNSTYQEREQLDLMAGMIEKYSALPSHVVRSGKVSRKANVVSEIRGLFCAYLTLLDPHWGDWFTWKPYPAATHRQLRCRESVLSHTDFLSK